MLTTGSGAIARAEERISFVAAISSIPSVHIAAPPRRYLATSAIRSAKLRAFWYQTVRFTVQVVDAPVADNPL